MLPAYHVSQVAAIPQTRRYATGIFVLTVYGGELPGWVPVVIYLTRTVDRHQASSSLRYPAQVPDLHTVRADVQYQAVLDVTIFQGGDLPHEALMPRLSADRRSLARGYVNVRRAVVGQGPEYVDGATHDHQWVLNGRQVGQVNGRVPVGDEPVAILVALGHTLVVRVPVDGVL